MTPRSGPAVVRRGRCQTCGRRFKLRRDGSVASHPPKGTAFDRWAECEGSGKTVAELKDALTRGRDDG